VCRDASHASSRVRAWQYVEPLWELGHDVDVLTWQPERSHDVARLAATLIARARRADVVVLVKPRIHPAVLAVLAQVQPEIWVDLDDAVWTWPAPFPNRFMQAARHARGFVAGSRWLATRLAERLPGATVALVPTAIDTAHYAPPARRSPQQPIVGWIGGPASLTDFIPPVADALRSLVSEGRIAVRVVCSSALDASVVPSEFELWTPETEVASLQQFDIGIMPLRDDERSWGRCGLKALQYMAVGAPIVASAIGAACEIVENDVSGILASTTSEWRDALASLADDEDRRAVLGAAAHRRVEDAFSVSVVAPQLAAALTPTR